MDAMSWEGWWQTRGEKALVVALQGGWLQRQRWFGGKARTVASLRVADHGWGHGPPTLLFAWVEVGYGDEGVEQYFVPMACVEHAPAHANVATADNVQLIDALADDDAAHAIVRLLTTNGVVPTSQGQVNGFVTALYRPIETEKLTVHRNLGEQSNTAIRMGDKLLLKVFRRLQNGPNPDFEVCRFLSLQAGYHHVPAILGALVASPVRTNQGTASTDGTTLAMLQPWMPNQGNGWQEALHAVGRLWNGGADDANQSAAMLLGDYEAKIKRLAERTAEMHLALATDPATPAFRPELLGLEDLRSVADRIDEHGRVAERRLGRPLPHAIDLGKLTAAGAHGMKIRVHGDYHLGQVLCVDGDYVILDFEGEPSRPLAERRAKHCPLKDVAGMVRSFDYAAQVALRDRLGTTADEKSRQMTEAWSDAAQRVFVMAYKERLGSSPLLPTDQAAFMTLLRLYVLDKALYEVDYELNNRPDWVSIPLRGIDRGARL